MEYKQKNQDIIKDNLLMIKNKDLEVINRIMEHNNIQDNGKMDKKMEMELGKIYKVINMLDNGLMEKYKDMEYTQLLKVKNMKGISLIFLNMEKLNKDFQMEIYSKEIILMENLKVLEFINLKNIIWFMKVILIKV